MSELWMLIGMVPSMHMIDYDIRYMDMIVYDVQIMDVNRYGT